MNRTRGLFVAAVVLVACVGVVSMGARSFAQGEETGPDRETNSPSAAIGEKSKQGFLWEKQLANGEKFVLSKRQLANSKPSRAEYERARKAFPKANIPLVTPDSAVLYTLALQNQAGTTDKVVWQRKWSQYKGMVSDIRVRDAVAGQGVAVVLYQTSGGAVSVEVVSRAAKAMEAMKEGRVAATSLAGAAFLANVVEDAKLEGSIEEDTLAARLFWADKQNSLWRYEAGKWVEKEPHVALKSGPDAMPPRL